MLQAPFILYVEVLEVEDMATSPVPQKMMTSLRTTKSEENLLANERPPSALSSANLQAVCLTMPHSSSTGALCAYDDNNDCWTPEDDEISQQVSLNNSLVY
jgi:phosphatidylinositol 4-kinase